MQDNDYKTWDNYANEYWPAEYLIDKQGHVRHTHFGEGEYPQTEALIRRLLGDNGAHARQLADVTPTGLLTAESYLGYARLANYVGTRPVPNVERTYHFASTIPQNTLSYDGRWRVGAEQIVAGKNARLRLRYQARDVYIVLGGHGTVHALVDGKPAGTIKVDAQRLYTVHSSKELGTGSAGAAVHARNPGVLVHLRLAGVNTRGRRRRRPDRSRAPAGSASARRRSSRPTEDRPRRPARRPGARDPGRTPMSPRRSRRPR